MIAVFIATRVFKPLDCFVPRKDENDCFAFRKDENGCFAFCKDENDCFAFRNNNADKSYGKTGSVHQKETYQICNILPNILPNISLNI